MQMIVTQAMIDEAWQAVGRAMQEYHDRERDRIDAQARLEQREAQLLANGVEGKNAEERRANMLLYLHNEHYDCEVAEYEAMYAKLKLDLARNEQDRVKRLLQLATVLERREESEEGA